MGMLNLIVVENYVGPTTFIVTVVVIVTDIINVTI